MRFFIGLAVFSLFFISVLQVSAQTPDPQTAILTKVDQVLKLQRGILIQLKEIKDELYVVKIRVSRHNRTTGAHVEHH